MRLSVIEMDNGESIFYNLGVFAEHENLIVFPYMEFADFYDEMEKRLQCIRNIIHRECPEDEEQPKVIRDMEPHLELLERELEFLVDFDVQTTLESFEIQKQENKTGKKVPDFDKEPLQCLIGL
jgi:hypothetical protein